MKSPHIQLVDLVEEKPKPGRFSLAVVISAIVHALLMLFIVRSYRPVSVARADAPIARYVELIQRDPKQFIEAPGRAVKEKPLSAPYSDANRRASGPNPVSGMPETKSPGDGRGMYQQPIGMPQPRGPQGSSAAPSIQQPAQRPSVSEQAAAFPPPSGNPQPQFSPDQTPYLQRTAPPAPRFNVDEALNNIGRETRRGGGADGSGLLQNSGGEKGFFEQGPLSFETQWFDWGEYAQRMVSRIRVNWYSVMPHLIRTGMPGRVVIRFTIHRDGRISDVTILESSGLPPYDHAAKKAIEQSSPLNALPKEFPNATERVTCAFYYNMEVPK